MSGRLCPDGYAAHAAWVQSVQPVQPPAGMNVTPDKATIDEFRNQSGDEYFAALDNYRKHLAACRVCGKDE